jgi:aminoglycoside phosphotransferase (APT) family kinase protein
MARYSSERHALPVRSWRRHRRRLLKERLPAPVAQLLAHPAEPLARLCAGLPPTLLHGDARLVNVAFIPDAPNHVALVDWQMVSTGPACLDLGFYLIGNARRRARGPEALIARYRALLEAALATSLPDDVWERMVSAGLLYGAALLLWDRALDAADQLPGAAEELNWWITQLERLV